MHAIGYRRFGAASDVLERIELPTPRPGPGEVLVDLAYSGVNPSDVKARAGSRPGVTEPPYPTVIPHSDGAGTISAVGEGVDPARLGQPVWIWNGQWQRPFGTCATQICLPDEQAPALPPGTGLETGAQLGIPGLTAITAVLGRGPVAGKTLLVQGGAGSVGYLAVQIARWAGAHVIATASPADHARLQEAGARRVFDYRDPDLAAQIVGYSGPVDHIVEVEFGRNINTNAQVIAENGTMAVYGSAKDMSPEIPFGPLLFKAATIEILLIYILPAETRLAMIASLHAALGEGALDLPVDAIHPLSQTARAHEDVENGHRSGATLVDVNA